MSIVYVEVENEAYRTRTGKGKDGKPDWTAHEQQIVIHGLVRNGFPCRYPVDSIVRLDDNNPQPYKPGRYVFAAESFRVGNFSRPEMAFPTLQPFAEFLVELQEFVKRPELKAA